MIHLAVFASGRGSNAQAIYDYFNKEESSSGVRLKLLVSNHATAEVMKRAENWGVDTFFCPETLTDANCDPLLQTLRSASISFIALAGFLKRIPARVIEAYPGRILNLHPAILPDFGGRGMYGMHVHRAVRKAGMKHSGISIHKVNEAYDEGHLIYQKRCKISSLTTAEEVAEAVARLEHKHYPKVIAKHIAATDLIPK